jgi:hypothetical protein
VRADPKVLEEAMKMMQNPLIMEQMKVMMQDPAVKERMASMLGKLGPDSGVDGAAGLAADPAALDRLFEKMQDPEVPRGAPTCLARAHPPQSGPSPVIVSSLLLCPWTPPSYNLAGDRAPAEPRQERRVPAEDAEDGHRPRLRRRRRRVRPLDGG